MRETELEERARAALDRGDPISAYDIAAEDHSDNSQLAYLRVLALARLGDWQTALDLYDRYDLAHLGDVDPLALKGRLLKDKAFDSPKSQRAALLREARDAYLLAFERTNKEFAGINAAAMSAMAGDRALAEQLAAQLLEWPAQRQVRSYWDAATRAEALLITGQLGAAREALKQAADMPDSTAAARGTTFQQLRRLLEMSGNLDAEGIANVLRPIRPRRVAHFCGHMFRAGDENEKLLADAVAEVLASEEVGTAIGALACGGDIIIAEQVLARGAELLVVLPFDRDDFIAQSVGEDWVQRFEACESAASSVYQASRMQFVSDDEQFAFGSQTAMGMAKLRAAQMHAEAVQIAICDDAPSSGPAGTSADMARWQSAGGRTRSLPSMGVARRQPAAKSQAGDAARERRALRVLVFADFQGFSRLPEQAIPSFWSSIMATCADALEPYSDAIITANTWGDGLHFVLREVEVAAPALIALRDSLAQLDLAKLGITGSSGMRIAVHFGSVYEMTDPVTGRPNFYGTEVSRAARLEAVTPPCKVYMTEPMAAAIEMSCGDRFRSRYVGRVTLPKNFGVERIYSLEQKMPG